MLSPFDPPSPEEEDEHAPPPIEDDPGFDDESGETTPELDIDLPPLPVVRPSAEDAPPALPFGAARPRPQVEGRLPWGTPEVTPVMLPPQGQERKDAPPALPDSLTRVEAVSPIPAIPRRLPGTSHRFDADVSQATATTPANRPAPIALLPAAR